MVLFSECSPLLLRTNIQHGAVPVSLILKGQLGGSRVPDPVFYFVDWLAALMSEGCLTHPAEPVGRRFGRTPRHVDDDGGQDDGEHDEDHVEAVVHTCRGRVHR